MKSRLKRVKALRARRDNQQTGPSAELLALLARLQSLGKGELKELTGKTCAEGIIMGRVETDEPAMIAPIHP